MSEADKMFERLEYKKFEGFFELQYISGNNSIIFKKSTKKVAIYSNGYNNEFDMQELQAINKKCEELGWI